MATWPTDPNFSALSVDRLDEGPDKLQLARAQMLAAAQRAQTLSELVEAIIEFGEPFLKAGGELAGRAYTKPEAVTYSASVALDARKSNVFYIGTLTNNVTISITNAADGQTIQVRLVQDGVGRSVTLPANVKVVGVANPTPNGVCWLVLTYVSSVDMWEGSYQWVPA